MSILLGIQWFLPISSSIFENQATASQQISVCKVTHLPQKHILGDIYSDMDPYDVQDVIKSQLALFRYFLKNPNLAVIDEGMPCDLIPSETSVISGFNADKQKLPQKFPLPKNWTDLKWEEQEILITYGATVVALERGLAARALMSASSEAELAKRNAILLNSMTQFKGLLGVALTFVPEMYEIASRI